MSEALTAEEAQVQVKKWVVDGEKPPFPGAGFSSLNNRCGTSKAPSGWYCIREIGHEGSCAVKKSRDAVTLEECSDEPITLREAFRMVSRRLRFYQQRARSHKEYMELLREWERLRDQLKQKSSHRAPYGSGVNFAKIRKDEAKRKREALAIEESDHAQQ